MLTFGSLFSGIGGLDLGFERAGFRCVWQVERDEFCRKVLRKHWPDVPQWDDVTTFTGEGFERPDVIVGGFPCQDLSMAGARAGLEGERSGLWWEFARVIRVFRPRYVVVENVPGILVPVGSGRPAPLGCVLGELARLGFDAQWSVVSARSVGSTQLRRRIFVIANAQGFGGRPRGLSARRGPEGQGAIDAEGLGEGIRDDADVDSTRLQGRTVQRGNVGQGGGRPLNEYVQRLETTPTLDATSGPKGPRVDVTAHLSGRGGGVLNPRWSEWYMGFPVGWCEILSEHLETA